MKGILIRNIAIFVLCIAAVAVVHAQQDDSGTGTENAPDPPNNPSIEKGVAFVNINRIFSESAYIESEFDEVNSEFLAREEELEAKIEELRLAREKQSRDRLTMTVSERTETTEMINEMELVIQRENRDLSEDKRLRFDSIQRDLERFVLEKIQEVSAEKENFIVFDLTTILFADKRLEITDEVIRRIDESKAAEAEASTSQ